MTLITKLLTILSATFCVYTAPIASEPTPTPTEISEEEQATEEGQKAGALLKKKIDQLVEEQNAKEASTLPADSAEIS